MGLAVRSIILYIALRADYFQSTLQPIEIVLAYDVGQVRVIAKADYACGTYLGNGGAGMMSCSYGSGFRAKDRWIFAILNHDSTPSYLQVTIPEPVPMPAAHKNNQNIEHEQRAF